jgi:hypothetical protein
MIFAFIKALKNRRYSQCRCISEKFDRVGC